MRLRHGFGWILLAGSLAACGDTSPASLVFVEFTPPQPRIGDIVTVKFAAIDSRGLPAEGTLVDFALQREAGGVSLSPLQSSTTQGSGEVITQVVAPGRVASVVVVATAGDKVAQSPVISFAGSTVSSRGITFQCGPLAGLGSGGIWAIGAYGGNRDLIAGVKVNCTAHVADRNGDGISGALVSFLSEAGTIGPLAESSTDVVGNATVLFKTSYPLPQDVLPTKYFHDASNTPTGQRVAPDWMAPWMWRQNPMISGSLPDPACPAGCDEPRRTDPIRPQRINNPRDNLVTMIAVTAGEEDFTDLNNNGVWDDGEPYTDTVEPFVDANDNGNWDIGELYIDTNGDGAWTGKNGVYDGSTLIWAANHILWTGLPNEYDYALSPPSPAPSGYIPTIQRILPAGQGPLLILHLGSAFIHFKVADPWFNSFAQTSGQDGCRTVATSSVVVFPEVFGWRGIRTSYQGVEDVFFAIHDAHTPEEPADGGPQPLESDYSVNMFCRTTASPEQGNVVEIPVGNVFGRVR